jgi:hypothetical protein
VAYDTAQPPAWPPEKAKVEAERAKAEKVIAEFAAELKAEQAQTAQAIAAFASFGRAARRAGGRAPAAVVAATGWLNPKVRALAPFEGHEPRRLGSVER